MYVPAISTGAFEGWPREATDFVEKAIARHGGWSAWEALGGLRLQVKSFSGIVGKLKGAGRTFALPTRIDIDPKAQRTVFPDYPRSGWQTEYERGAIAVVPAADSGESGVQRDRYRESFVGGWRALRPWSDLDIAYFIGYSMPQYHAYPFSLPSLSFVRCREYRGEGGTWIKMTLDYPAGIDSHSQRQTFHFDSTGLLRRVDYRAEIVGPGPAAAHHYDNYTSVAGLQFPQRRRVLGQVFGRAIGVNLLTADFELSPR